MSQYKYIKFCLTMKMKVAQIRSNQISHSVVSDSLWPHESQHCQASMSITNSWSSLRLTSIESVIPSSHLILCHPLLLLPPVPPSIRVFSNESTLLMRWPKYWSFSFSIIPSKEIPPHVRGQGQPPRVPDCNGAGTAERSYPAYVC